MCKIGIMLGTAGENLPSAILFMNSNKSEKNIRKKVAKTREKCLSHGIILGHDVVICKGPDRDVDRDAVNLLISFLMTGQYDMVAVDKLTDLTEDVSDMEELMKDAAKIGVGFLELSTMDYYEYTYQKPHNNLKSTHHAPEYLDNQRFVTNSNNLPHSSSLYPSSF